MLRRLFKAAAITAIVVLVVIGVWLYWFLSRDGFRRALEEQATTWLGQPVRIGTARAQFLPRVAIQLGDIHLGEPARLTLDDVELAADLGPLLAGRIENADVRVSDSLFEMPLPFDLPEGGSSQSGGAIAVPVRIVSIRSISLRDVRLRSRGREIAVSADSSLDGTTLTLSRFSASSERTTLDVEGVIALWPRIDAQLRATAPRLDVDELAALGAAFAGEPGSAAKGAGGGQGARIVANINAGEGTAGAVPFRQFTTTLRLDGDAMALDALRFELFGGRYEGSVTARIGTSMTATLEARVVDVDVAQLAAFGGAAGSITGRLTSEGTFRGAGAGVAELLRSARGAGVAAIADGSITQLHLVRTVVLFFGRPAPDAQESTDHFERLDARFMLSNRVLRANALSLRSSDADVAGAGTLNLDSDALDGRADLVLSEALSAQAGTDLYRYAREGNRIVLPALIGGTLGAPRLTIDAAAAVKRGLRNEIERKLKGVLEGFGF